MPFARKDPSAGLPVVPIAVAAVVAAAIYAVIKANADRGGTYDPDRPEAGNH